MALVLREISTIGHHSIDIYPRESNNFKNQLELKRAESDKVPIAISGILFLCFGNGGRREQSARIPAKAVIPRPCYHGEGQGD